MIGKEGLLNYYLYRYWNVLEEVIQMKFKDSELEKYYKIEESYRKVDVVFLTIDNKKIFVETQLTKANTKHLQQVLSNIDNSDVVIWIAKKFDEKILSKVEEKIMNIKKSIKFYALTINSHTFNILNFLYLKETQFATLNISELNSIDKILQVHKEISNCNTDNRNVILQNIDFYIKQRIKDDYKFQFSKRISNYQMFYGSTVTDITYCISINKIGEVRIGLLFAPCRRDKFDIFIGHCEQIRSESNMDIRFISKTRTIAYNVDYEVNTLEDCRQVAEAFAKFYYSIHKYISI